MTRRNESAMYVPRMDALLNRWFTSYEQAYEVLEADGGYLLPYEDQFFVTVPDAIRELQGDHYFAADEIFVSDDRQPTTALHLAFQAADHDAVQRFTRWVSRPVARTTGHPVSGTTTPVTTAPTCWTPTATTSRPFFTDRPSALRPRSS